MSDDLFIDNRGNLLHEESFGSPTGVWRMAERLAARYRKTVYLPTISK